MSGSEIQTRRLDLAARAIDLVSALTSATNTSSQIVRLVWEVGQWLGREGVNQYELQDCIEKARGLVRPNENADPMFLDILEGSKRKSIGPLFLEQSGSLGRLMVKDPALRWMVSTTACLFQFHSDIELISAMLIALIMENRRDESVGESDSLFYKPAQVRIKAVVEKIVLSVWHNVVNAGYKTIPLPSELSAICEQGHDLDPSDLAKVAHILTTRCRWSAILKTKHLLRNITLWLLLHYDGNIVVSLKGVVVYRTKLGHTTRELELKIEHSCQDFGSCEQSGFEQYTIMRSIGDTFEFFLSGYSTSGRETPSMPGTRRALYERPTRYPRESAMWNPGVRNLIRETAQKISRWLMQVELAPQQDFDDLGFQVKSFTCTKSNSSSPPVLTVSVILNRLPGILNLNWGLNARTEIASFFPGPYAQSDESYHGSDDLSRRLSQLCECFPNLADLVQKLTHDCGCHVATSSSLGPVSLSGQTCRDLRSGCLARIAIEEVLLFLAQAIADGFGVEDVSGIPNNSSVTHGMCTLLLELVHLGRLRWDTWFSVAACTYLGCPFREKPGPDHAAFGGTSIAAFQFGDLVVQAPWLDLDSSFTWSRCFRLITARGRLGVVHPAAEECSDQFRAVEANFAIIETEGTESASTSSSRFPKYPITVSSNKIDTDTTDVASDVILVSIHDCYYRLLTRIKTPHYWRIIDPSDAMSATIRAIELMQCTHHRATQSANERRVIAYTFEDIVGHWPLAVMQQATGGNGETQGVFHVSRSLDTYLKFNIANALAVCTTGVYALSSQACLTCNVDGAGKVSRQPLRSGEGGNAANRYIVYLDDSVHGQVTLA